MCRRTDARSIHRRTRIASLMRSRAMNGRARSSSHDRTIITARKKISRDQYRMMLLVDDRRVAR
jgi:hypothetical protein